MDVNLNKPFKYNDVNFPMAILRKIKIIISRSPFRAFFFSTRLTSELLNG